MRKSYQVKGISLLSKGQLQELKKLHKKDPQARFLIPVPEDDLIAETLRDALSAVPYAFVMDAGEGEVLDLSPFQEELLFKNISHFADPFPYRLMRSREYVREMLTKEVKEKRYIHSLSVAQTAEKLAAAHGLDPEKAYLAGLLHDMAKSMSEEENDEWLRHYDPQQLSAPFGIKHGYTAKYYLQHVCLFEDKEILNAIYHHSDGDSSAPLAMIIYIADKREPLRGFDDGILQLAEKDLPAAFHELKKKVADYLGDRRYDGKRS